MIIPVEWVSEKRTILRSRETLVSAIKAFNDEKCVVLFPSGRLAFMDEQRKLTEQEWLPSVAIFARKYDCPIVPAHIEARNSWLYYWFWKLNTELRDITLFHELLNKKGKTYKIIFGAPIEPGALKGDPQLVAAALREHAASHGNKAKSWQPLLAN
jgi:putative hemolysin